MKEISRAYEPSFIDYEEKQLQKIQNKIDQFQVDVHPAVRLRNFENTGRGLCATKNIVKGNALDSKWTVQRIESGRSMNFPISRLGRSLLVVWTMTVYF